MTGFTRLDLPADIHVFAGTFASQPLAFAHLFDVAPTLDLGHVEVIRRDGAEARLGAYFKPETTRQILSLAPSDETLLLVLPAAFDGLTCPLAATELLGPLGSFRGTVPRMIATKAAQ